MPTNSDVLAVIVMCFAIGLLGLGALGYMAWDIHRSVKEAQRMTRAVAGLVVQESDKIRALMSR